MIIKYAYAYAEPRGTFYIGLEKGIQTHSFTAQAMADLARTEGSLLAHVRRAFIAPHVTGPFELVNVTPKQVEANGLRTPEDILELQKLVKFDPPLQAAVASLAEKIEEARVSAIDVAAATKEYLSKFLDKSIEVDVKQVDGGVVTVTLQVPASIIQGGQHA